MATAQQCAKNQSEQHSNTLATMCT